MKKLIQGILDFRKNILPGYREAFARLALDQAPDSLFVACSDSRVVPNLFASSNPGDLFVLRNVGNLIPQCNTAGICEQDRSAGAAVEFAVKVLKVKDIIICGHSDCGAMQALLKEAPSEQASNLQAWLEHGKGALEKFRQGRALDPKLKPYDQLSQLNVLEQMDHVKKFPWVQERINQGDLTIHGWWFDIRHADVYAYEAQDNRFLLIDETEAERIMKRLKESPAGNQ